MRTWGRPYTNGKPGAWTEVTTDADGFNDYVYITTLAQVLRLNLGESPFFGAYGIPAHQSVMTRVFPDYYVSFTQQQFAQYFATLAISKEPLPAPTYNVNITTHRGVLVPFQVPIPQ